MLVVPASLTLTLFLNMNLQNISSNLKLFCHMKALKFSLNFVERRKQEHFAYVLYHKVFIVSWHHALQRSKSSHSTPKSFEDNLNKKWSVYIFESLVFLIFEKNSGRQKKN